MTQHILERLYQLTEPAPVPIRWPFVPPHPRVRRRNVDAKTFVDALRSEFARDELLASRVLVNEDDVKPRLAPVLGEQTTSWLFLTRDEAGTPCDIVTRFGSLMHDDPPCFTARENFDTRTRIGNTPCVLATSSEADLTLLAQLQLPVTTSARLEEMSARGARRLFAIGQRSGEMATACRRSCRIVFVACQIAKLSLDPPPPLARVLDRLNEVQAAFHVDIAKTFGIWHPTAAEFERIRLSVKAADVQQAYAQLRKSILDSTCSIQEFYLAQPTAPNAVFAARRELASVIDRAADGLASPTAVAAALETYRRAFAETFMEPLLSTAAMLPEPLQRALTIVAPPLIEHLDEMTDLVQRAKRASRGENCRSPDGLSPDTLKEILQVTNELTKISRELTRTK